MNQLDKSLSDLNIPGTDVLEVTVVSNSTGEPGGWTATILTFERGGSDEKGNLTGEGGGAEFSFTAALGRAVDTYHRV